MNVPFLNLKAQYLSIKSEVDQAITKVLESQQFILGAEVQECEKAIADYSNCSFGIGVSSGTDALLVCLMAEKIGLGDEVITTPHTFFATAGAIARVGARPIFVDIDPVTYNLNTAQIASKITAKSRAIIPVHLYGQMADMDPIIDIAQKHGLIVIEDAAQAIGAEYKKRRAGSIGHYGCFSFFPSKNLGAAGDAGMVVTNDGRRAEDLRSLRSHGWKAKYYNKLIGGNFRLDSLQAAIILAKLPYLDDWTAARQRNAELYNILFNKSGIRVADTAQCVHKYSSPRRLLSYEDQCAYKAPQVLLPKVVTERHIFNQYIIRVSHRDKLKDALHRKGVATEVYYPVPMHLQECFSFLGFEKGSFPECESAAMDTLALPIYPELTEEQIRFVVECVYEFFSTEIY